MIIDWITIEKDFITSEIDYTYKEIAEKHNINYLTLKKRACDYNWREKREKHKLKIINKACNKVAMQKADKIVEITNNVLDALYQSTKELQDYEEVNNQGEIVKVELSTIQIKKVESIVKSITQIQRVQLEKQRVDLEKMKIERDESSEDKLSQLLGAVESLAYNDAQGDYDE